SGLTAKIRYLLEVSGPPGVTGLKEDWDEEGNLDFAFSAMGFTISGKVVTCDKQVKVNGDLPFAALPFRGMIEEKMAEKIREAIA
ncbi:MAG: hypothetical protein AAF456_20480, partial [Planctomycetota bacterium]